MRPRALGKVAHAIVQAVGNGRHHAADERHLDDEPLLVGRVDRALRGGRVGPHEPTRPQQRAAKVARHHTANVGKAGAAQHLERGHAARALGLAVVARALAAVGEDPGRHVVPCVVVAGANGLDERGSLVLRLHVRELRDEAALAVDELGRGLRAGTHREVGDGARARSASRPRGSARTRGTRGPALPRLRPAALCH